MKTIFKLLLIITPALGLTMLPGCRNKATADDPPRVVVSDSFFRYIQLDTVKVKQVENELALTGKITYDENKVARIYPFAGGIIESLQVQLGDYVHKGQVLAVIRSMEAADYSSQLITAQSNLSIARKNLESAQNFYNNGLMSEKDYQAAKDELDKAQGEYDRISQITSIMGGDDKGLYKVIAPQSGYIVEKNATEKMEFRSDNNGNCLFTIADLDHVYVVANVYESDISSVKLGCEALITTLSYPDHVFKGKIDKIYNVIDPDTKVMKVRITMPNPGLMLKPEMFANISLIYPDKEDMNYVPSTAVIFDKNSNWVVVFHSRDSIEARQVTPYKVFGPVTYISSGLKPGEVVVSKKALLLYDALND